MSSSLLKLELFSCGISHPSGGSSGSTSPKAKRLRSLSYLRLALRPFFNFKDVPANGSLFLVEAGDGGGLGGLIGSGAMTKRPSSSEEVPVVSPPLKIGFLTFFFNVFFNVYLSGVK